MRQIKFRAQDIASNKWLYGDLRHHKDDVCIFGRGCNKGEQVKCDTIGQFVGLKDKNGKEIYEGDIVKWAHDGLCYVVAFRRGMFFASAHELNEDVYGGYPLWMICDDNDLCEIIGNIHDNPSMLKNS